MNTAITEGIRITVMSQFRPDLSQLGEAQYFFNYRIEIENKNSFAVQLMHRDWFVFDSLNHPQQISGEGVIGEQPVIQPGNNYHYISGCELSSEIGYMKGYYTFRSLLDNSTFQVFIPTFQLIYPQRLN